MAHNHDTEQAKVFAELESKGRVIHNKYVCTCINYPLLTRDLVSAGRAAEDNIRLLELLNEQLDRERGAKSVNSEGVLFVNGTDENRLKRTICKAIENELKALKQVKRTDVSDEDKERVREALNEWRGHKETQYVSGKQKNSRKRKTEFVDRINKETEAERVEVLERLRKVVYKDKYKGKDMALLIMCLEVMQGLTSKVCFPELERAFNCTDIGNSRGYYNYRKRGPACYSDDERNLMAKVVKNALK